jgi:hypothetical protein
LDAFTLFNVFIAKKGRHEEYNCDVLALYAFFVVNFKALHCLKLEVALMAR